MGALNSELKKSSAATRCAIHGLSLGRSALNALQKRGIYCQPVVSVEHQHLANRYVLRGVESGGAVSDLGRACGFVTPDGNPLPWFQRIDSIGVNGRHAIFLAESLVRLEMLRAGRTCELVVTLHTLSYLAGPSARKLCPRYSSTGATELCRSIYGKQNSGRFAG